MSTTIPPVVDSGPREEPPKVASEELFRGGKVVVITHQGETYRLLLTRNNRLILQK